MEGVCSPRFRYSTAEEERLKESVLILPAAFANINIAKC
jgi:hypothetical protein